MGKEWKSSKSDLDEGWYLPFIFGLLAVFFLVMIFKDLITGVIWLGGHDAMVKLEENRKGFYLVITLFSIMAASFLYGMVRTSRKLNEKKRESHIDNGNIEGQPGMINLYTPDSETELAMLKSLFDAEHVDYFVFNDHFGSLRIGPPIALFNAKAILVREKDHEKAKIILDEYLANTKQESDGPPSKFSWRDKARMIMEVFFFGWFIPGKRRKPRHKD